MNDHKALRIKIVFSAKKANEYVSFFFQTNRSVGWPATQTGTYSAGEARASGHFRKESFKFFFTSWSAARKVSEGVLGCCYSELAASMSLAGTRTEIVKKT